MQDLAHCENKIANFDNQLDAVNFYLPILSFDFVTRDVQTNVGFLLHALLVLTNGRHAFQLRSSTTAQPKDFKSCLISSVITDSGTNPFSRNPSSGANLIPEQYQSM